MPTEGKLFNEQSLYNEIVKIWGLHGAHAEVYKMVCEKAGLELTDPEIEETIEAKIKRIYAEEGNSLIKTIKRVRWEIDEGRLDLRAAKELVERNIS
jgi:hypothetical protein